MNTLSTILIVDDHAANRDTLTELLQNKDYRLVEAADGPEALKLAAELLPDLILLDVMMPEMDGFEVCRRLRADPKLAEVPVIMVTALDDRQSRIMGIGCGADDFVSKPYDHVELRTRVRTVTRLNRYARLLRERAKVEEANERIREQAALIDLATDAIVVLDMAGVVQSWNPGAKKIFGTTSAYAHGKPLATLFSQEDSAQLQTALTQTAESGEWRGDLAIFRPNGDKLVVHSHWTLMRQPDGTPRGILTVSTDQTEFKQLQAQFYRAQRMESLGALAGGIAHDLNNMLAPVMMSAEMLQTNPPPEIQAEIVRVIQSSAQRGAAMVRQILSFARGSDGDAKALVQSAHLVNDLVRMAKETFPKTIAVTTHVEKDLVVIRADATQIYQVLLNLLVNARDAMPDGGTLTVSAANSLVDPARAERSPGAKSGPHVVLRVSDSGAGIPPEVLAKIWNPFFTTKPPGKGTGIGLSTVAKIVKSHGGFVDVESEPGHGTTFSVSLPAEVEKESKVPAALAALPLGRGERVLVVDDEAALGQMVQSLLTEHGYKVTVANGPAPALSAFGTGENFDLAVVDLNMPVMDGVQLAKVMHDLKPQFKIILLTGAPQVVPADLEAGHFAAVVAKSVTPESLLVAMDQALHAEVALAK